MILPSQKVSPAMKEILATSIALNPDADTVSGAYYFFVTDAAGNYYYGRTLAEHQANCKKAGL